MDESSCMAFGFAVAFVLAGCGQQPATSQAPFPATAGAPSEIHANPPPHAPVTSPLFGVDPTSLNACDPAVVGIVKWDVREAYPESSAVAIWAGAGPDAKLFARGGASGESRTGQWLRPGSEFDLKDQATGKLLGHIKVGGPDCAD